MELIIAVDLQENQQIRDHTKAISGTRTDTLKNGTGSGAKGKDPIYIESGRRKTHQVLGGRRQGEMSCLR